MELLSNSQYRLRNINCQYLNIGFSYCNDSTNCFSIWVTKPAEIILFAISWQTSGGRAAIKLISGIKLPCAYLLVLWSLQVSEHWCHSEMMSFSVPCLMLIVLRDLQRWLADFHHVFIFPSQCCVLCGEPYIGKWSRTFLSKLDFWSQQWRAFLISTSSVFDILPH